MWTPSPPPNFHTSNYFPLPPALPLYVQLYISHTYKNKRTVNDLHSTITYVWVRVCVWGGGDNKGGWDKWRQEGLEIQLFVCACTVETDCDSIFTDKTFICEVQGSSYVVVFR